MSHLSQWRLLPGGLHHRRLWNVDVTSLEEKYYGAAIFVGTAQVSWAL